MNDDVVSERVEIAVGDGSVLGAYVARLAALRAGGDDRAVRDDRALRDGGDGRAVRPAVIVGFEMFGVTAYVRRVADRLARLGYVAMVPDFYHRTAPGFEGVVSDEGRAAGYALLQRLERDEVRADVHAAMAWLRALPAANGRIGMMGLSLGGHLAFYAATQADLAATAVVYPGWLDVDDTALSKPSPVLGLTAGIAEHGGRLLYLAGGDDHVISSRQAVLLGEELADAGVPHEIVVYPGVPHGFLADERETFDPEVAADAWGRIEALFAEALMG